MKRVVKKKFNEVPNPNLHSVFLGYLNISYWLLYYTLFIQIQFLTNPVSIFFFKRKTWNVFLWFFPLLFSSHHHPTLQNYLHFQINNKKCIFFSFIRKKILERHTLVRKMTIHFFIIMKEKVFSYKTFIFKLFSKENSLILPVLSIIIFFVVVVPVSYVHRLLKA